MSPGWYAMSPDLDYLLCVRFPLLYRDRRVNIQYSSMPWGFEAGDGWFGLLLECSREIERELVRLRDEEGVPAEELPCAAQVKEKWGTLRFYMTGYTDAIEAAIGRAEARSRTECEECGAAGEVREGGYVLTLCDRCNQERVDPAGNVV